MAYNVTTGETTLNGRTYTLHRRGFRTHFRTITNLANTNARITDPNTRALLITAVSTVYHLNDDRTAFAIGRSMIRALRAEATV